MHEIHVAPLMGLREPFCALSHLFGAIVFALLTPRLVKAGDGQRLAQAGLSIFASASVLTLTVSTLYHTTWPGPTRDFLLRADVAVIFLMIAGSTTPVHLILFRGAWRWAPLILSWMVALVGVGVHLAAGRSSPGTWGTLVFLAFGWGALISAIKVWRRFGWHMIRRPALAGLSYTIGAIVLIGHWPTILPGVIGPHELWHVAVLCALSWQWIFMFELLERLRQIRTLKTTGHILKIVPPSPTAGFEKTGGPQRKRAA
jgi:channel protein (hemolysin III family)